jgi:hypothetical protein
MLSDKLNRELRPGSNFPVIYSQAAVPFPRHPCVAVREQLCQSGRFSIPAMGGSIHDNDSELAEAIFG